jgi:hypothetical protein
MKHMLFCWEWTILKWLILHVFQLREFCATHEYILSAT